MLFSRRLSRFFVVPVALAGLSSACMGRVDPGTGDPSSSSSGASSGSSSGPPSSSSSSGGASGSSSGSGSSGSSSGVGGSSSSSGSPGDPDCSILVVPDLARVCPDGTSVGGQYVISNHQCVLEFPCPPSPPPGGDCSQGATCEPSSGCGTASTGGNGGCQTSCSCDGTGHYQCSITCSTPDCSPGASCTPGTACGSSGANTNCGLSCTCNANGFFDCGQTDCADAGPPPIMDPCPGLAVPDICEVCSNGTTECAHAILLKGQCQVEICPGQ